MNRQTAVNFLLTQPAKFGQLIGFKDLTELHNGWIIKMIQDKNDATLQAHRGSYKTTCVAIALALIIILKPTKTTLFMRKTDNDIKEVIRTVKKILEDPKTRYFVRCIYGAELILTKASAQELNTNLNQSVKGAAQLTGLGTGGSLTGKHYDLIFTDDIVNLEDRGSRAERERTKRIYQELQNIKNRGGRIFNTGTPWHKDDAFSIMPEPEKFSVYDTGLVSKEEIQALKTTMTAALFAANYELRHIAEDDVLFTNPQTGANPEIMQNCDAHIDAAYGGEDYTAYTQIRKYDGKIYVLGKLYHKHVDDVLPEILALHSATLGGRIYNEKNGDKGYLSKELKQLGQRPMPYQEKMNKYLKITTYLKGSWEKIIFVEGTDRDYINQICDYNENAEHDDAPDSLASLIRIKWDKRDEGAAQGSTYRSLLA